MLHSYVQQERERCMCIQLHELLRYIIWAPPCLRVLLCDMQLCNVKLLLMYNTHSCFHLALQKPPTMSQLTCIADRFIYRRRLFSVAMHLDFSHSFCQQHIPRYLEEDKHSKCTREFLALALKWLDREKGTGGLPRTRDTLMKALQKLDVKKKESLLKTMHEILTQE